MKKLVAMLAVAAFVISCNDTETTSSATADSARAAATADSLAAINAMADTSKMAMDTTMMKADSSMKIMQDTTKK